MKVLIIEDEPDMLSGLRDNFEFEGYEVVTAKDGRQALDVAAASKPDLIILDVMLPKMSGIDVCRQLRSKGAAMPIIMLTARGQEIDKVVGLEVGADDYVTKPFSIKELLARVRAHLRRASRQVADVDYYSFGNIEISFSRHQITKARQPLEFSPREFDILKYFIQRRGEAITRDQLLDAVWGYHNFPLTRTVDNHIAKLRQKIEDIPADPQYIITIHRVGYKFLG
ncbi:MAG: response regulator transcription factor [Acidobacteria bacterium]|nr:response regulator transcription factor [Acidobacteriota bacterium]